MPAGAGRVRLPARRLPAGARHPREDRGQAAVSAQPRVHHRGDLEARPADPGRARTSSCTGFFNVESVDPIARTVTSLEGETVELRPAGPGAAAPRPEGDRGLEASATSAAGCPVDKNTLKHTQFEDIWAIGDATNIPISKSGSVAHYEATVAAAEIVAAVKGEAPPRTSTTARSCASSRPARARRRPSASTTTTRRSRPRRRGAGTGRRRCSTRRTGTRSRRDGCPEPRRNR